MEYTAAEKMVIEYFGLGRYITLESRVCPPEVYKMAAEKAFLDNDTSKYARALRAAYQAICDCNPCRHTPEFDNLILSELDNSNG
jgi:hypothetical protein